MYVLTCRAPQGGTAIARLGAVSRRRRCEDDAVDLVTIKGVANGAPAAIVHRVAMRSAPNGGVDEPRDLHSRWPGSVRAEQPVREIVRNLHHTNVELILRSIRVRDPQIVSVLRRFLELWQVVVRVHGALQTKRVAGLVSIVVVNGKRLVVRTGTSCRPSSSLRLYSSDQLGSTMRAVTSS